MMSWCGGMEVDRCRIQRLSSGSQHSLLSQLGQGSHLAGPPVLCYERIMMSNYLVRFTSVSRHCSLSWLLLAVVACAGSDVSSFRPLEPNSPASYREGDIFETSTGRRITLDQLMERLRQQEVVYLGEEHHNRYHIEGALTLLGRLTAEGRRPVLAMEMFGWDGQSVLDQYVGMEELSRQEFLNRIAWLKNWGGPFEDYEPLVVYARSQHLRLVALNPPKPLVRLVAKKGLARARQEAEWTTSAMQDEPIVDDPAYREKIIRQLRACHDGGPEELFQTMYEASMVRDEGMAKTIVSLVEALRDGRETSGGPVVSYTGGGHIQYNLPVPKRVARRLDGSVRQISVYMTSFEKDRLDDLHEMVTGKIADFVWLTRVSAEGPPRRCR